VVPAQNFVFVVSGPSGSGKTTLCDLLAKKQSLRLVRSVSCTTRPQRIGERNGKDYWFISKKEFKKKINQGYFVEHKYVFGHWYGTPKRSIIDAFKKHRDVVLSIDVKGALSVRRSFRKHAVLVFVLPPSKQQLKQRIYSRAREGKKEMQKRLDFAKIEISYAARYDYFVINDTVAHAIHELESIVMAKRLESTHAKRCAAKKYL